VLGQAAFIRDRGGFSNQARGHPGGLLIAWWIISPPLCLTSIARCAILLIMISFAAQGILAVPMSARYDLTGKYLRIAIGIIVIAASSSCR